MTAQEAFLLARAYTNKAIEGGGALKGAACQIQSITAITGGHRITFAWEDNDGNVETDTMDVMDGTDGQAGVGISTITYKETDAQGNYVYTITLTSGSTYDITCPKGPQGATGATGADGADGQDGADGVGITSITKTGTSGLVDTYTITYTNGTTSTFTVTNGQDGNSNEFIGTLAEWNAKTTEQKKEYDTYQITDDYSEALMPNYSTTEQKTGQKWIDGKDIYFKVINTAVAIEQVDTWYSTGFTGVDYIINYIPKLTRDGEQIGDTFNNGRLDYIVRNNELLVKGVGFTLADNFVIVTQIIYYTKTA